MILAPDEIRKRRIVEMILRAFLTEKSASSVSPSNVGRGANLALRYLDGASLKGEDIRSLGDEVSALSLFSPLRFFIVRHVEALPSESHKQLLTLCERLSRDSKLILTGSKLADNLLLKRYFVERRLLIELAELKGEELSRWTAKELRRAGLSHVSQGAINALIEIGERLPDQISKLAEHLALYCDTDRAGEKDIMEVFHHRALQGDFAFLEVLNQGKIAQAESLLNELFASGKSPFMMLALLAKTFSSYLAIKALLAKNLPATKIRESLNITPWVFNKQLLAVKSYSLCRLKQSLEAILRADSKLKHRSLGAEAIFSELAYSIAGGGNPTP